MGSGKSVRNEGFLPSIWVLGLFLCLNTTYSIAHTTEISEYSINKKGDRWVLSFYQKTSQLRDAIYAGRPELKGMNLNSETFLQATSDHIENSVLLMQEGVQLNLIPEEMNYGGLRFSGEFELSGIESNPEKLVIKANAFEEHEHAILVFKVMDGAEGYLYYFNKDRREAIFDFKTKHYSFQEEAERQFGSSNWVVISLLFSLILIYLNQVKKTKSYSKVQL